MKWSLNHLAILIALVAVMVTHAKFRGHASPLDFVSALFLVGVVAEAFWISANIHQLPAIHSGSLRIRRLECCAAGLAILLGHGFALAFAKSSPFQDGGFDPFDRLAGTVHGLMLGGIVLAMPAPESRSISGMRRLRWIHFVFWPCAAYLLYELAFVDGTYIILLTNLAIEAIEHSLPIAQYAADSDSLYAGLHPDGRERAADFFLNCRLSILPVTLAAVFGILTMRQWRRPQWARIWCLACVLCLTASCVFPAYLIRGGLRAYSPPLAEASFVFSGPHVLFIVLIAALGSIWLARCWRLNYTNGTVTIHSAFLFHRTWWGLLCLFCAWQLVVVKEAWTAIRWVSRFVWDDMLLACLVDPKQLFLAAVGCRALWLVIRYRASPSILSETRVLDGSRLVWYLFGIATVTVFLLVASIALLWFQYSMIEFWTM